jgi:hypothetical protein
MPANKDSLDFIVIGTQKSGTSSLFHYLRHHPEIFIPRHKEVPYFSHDPAVLTVEWSTYMSNIARQVFFDDQPGALADPGRKWGTVTPQYTAGGVWDANGDAPSEAGAYDERTVPSRIRERLPNVRLIAILRDPVARALSHHRMLVRIGRERDTFDAAVARLLRHDALESARRQPRETTGYIVWGEYGRILSGYFDVFPREQILVVFTDELERDPTRLLTRVQEFIGVSADFAPVNLGEQYNVGRPQLMFTWTRPSTWLSLSSPMSPQGVRRALAANPAVRAVWRKVPTERQRRLLTPYERIGGRVARWNRRRAPTGVTVTADAEPSPATLARLRAHYAEDGQHLAELLGVAPPWLAAGDDSARR